MNDGSGLFGAVPIIFVAVGAFTLLKALLAVVRESAFTRSAVAVEGEVTDVRKYERRRQRSGNRSGSYTVTTYAPVLRFLLPDGRQVEAEAYEETGDAPSTGARVTVRYDPEDPTHCRTDGRTAGRFGGHAVQAVFGALFAAVGLFLLVANGRL